MSNPDELGDVQPSIDAILMTIVIVIAALAFAVCVIIPAMTL